MLFTQAPERIGSPPTAGRASASSADIGDAQRRAGFTLFEVALSLALVAFGVVSVAMLFPIGIKAEQMARLSLYAGVKAEEIIESFADSANANPSSETEAPSSWEVPAGYRVMTPDLESRVSSHRYGIMPLPTTIAARIDSDGDEIHTILSQGGYLYYSQAPGTAGMEESLQAASSVPMQPDNQTQKLVFAVTGYAQNNNLAHLAWKNWPYYEPYPSPPGHGEKQNRNIPADATARGYPFGYQSLSISPWEGVGTGGADNGAGTTDGDIVRVFDSRGTPNLGFHPYALGGSNNLAGAIGYLQTALWYCARKGIDPTVKMDASVYAPSEPFTPTVKAEEQMVVFRSLADNDKWKWVQALRFLSHAATCMTRWKTLAELGGQPSSSVGVDIPSVMIDGGLTPTNSPQISLTHDKIVYYHELCERTVMLYAASQPYDWGAPRPTERAIMTDYPLIEYDIGRSPSFPPLSGPIYGSGQTATQWRPIAARPIVNVGRSYCFPDTPIPAANWGDPADFTLARPFAAAERCRQLVFWAVDWQSYEDFETAPSAPVDASKYLFACPITGQNFDFRMGVGVNNWIDHHVYQYRNPEKVITFTNKNVPTLPTGSDVSSQRILNANGYNRDQGAGTGAPGSDPNIYMFNGLWGADRNFNGKLDRGPVPRSVRLRAVLVGRYNYYDPRLTLKVR